MRKYTAVQGDYWDGIAKKIYSDESYMNTLLLANPSLTGLTVFDGGETVLVPDVAIKLTAIKPPWKG